MAFPTDEIVFGPRAYGPRKGTEAVVLHTLENAGPSREQALSTIKLQSPGGSLYAGGGSYHWVICSDGLILTVGYTDSAGSLTGDHTPPSQISPITGKPGVWSLDENAKVALSPAAEAGTNAYVIAVAFSGKASVLSADVAAKKPYALSMIDTAARLVRWIEQQDFAPNDIPVLDHEDFQTNRSDPGPGVNAAIILRYAELYLPVPTPIPAPILTPEQRIAIKNSKFDEAGRQVRNLERTLSAAELTRFAPFLAAIRKPLRGGRQA